MTPVRRFRPSLLAACAACLAAVPAAGQGPPADPPAEVIVLPDCRTPAGPVAAPVLTADRLYVFETDADVLVTSSPPGKVTISEDAGPLTIRGIFVGNTQVSTRAFRKKHVYTVDPAPGQSGRVELLVIPKGVRFLSQISRAMLDVNGPAPVPPGPTPPGPNPPPPPPPVVDPLLSPVRAALGADVSPTKLADAAALAAVYRSLAETGVPDPRVRTAGDLAAVVSAARAARIADRLPAVRDILGGEFEKAVPSDPAAVLTADQKQAAARLFARFADILEAATRAN